MAQSLLDNFLNCPVCLETFTEPVTLGCHHSFCGSCLRDSWDKNKTKNCPVCRRKSSKGLIDINFSLNQLSIQFKTTVLTEKDQKSPSRPPPDQPDVCSRHPGVPSLFWKDDGRAVCLVCEFCLHQRHTVVRVEEQEELKEQMRTELESLTRQRGSYKDLERTFEKIQEHCDHQGVLCERQIKALFSRLNKFLKQEETRALEALREEQQRQARTMGPDLGRIREELASVERNIQELKELLNRDTVLHYSPQHPLQTTPAPELRPGLLLDEAKVVGNLGFGVWRRMRREVSYSPFILDPNTASKWLFLADDLRGVRQERMKFQKVPDNPERFSNYAFVLGSEGFISGTHQWEIEVQDHPAWAVGVAKESVKRKWRCDPLHENGVWRFGMSQGEYFDVFCKPLTLPRHPERVRVQLDYDRGQLTFTDADHMTPICSYTGTFTEKVLPVLYVGEAGEAKTKDIRICLSDGPAESVIL